ncbi:MAG TPA: UDP-N-acetylglucosamine--N-acetylmuramyl-(pentapeptide) pyrophosphoryl-undecaprenol N-acetylglucosamine transferase [Candidatus Paceibacterota bacterium]|nr:UDP-N-acetylglucosamine--N-acetylmuramyl-(pentapeptide) pyrophosphoryl-undecaprenol N-acetylglucosamine transferase [Candidatus Paceibacterota bacterium]
MKIVFTGGGTGGHFYPIIAIAEALSDLVREERLLAPSLYYFAPTPFDEKALFENGIDYVYVPAGKVRRYFSFRNMTDATITFTGILKAIVSLFHIYPDVVVSKGGYASVPTVLAARLLRIPIIIHESDAKPGRANLLAAKFATKIAISFESAAAYFPKNAQGKIARTGIPIRKALMRVEAEGARQYLGLESTIPTILILGGSQGAVKINDIVLSALPDLVSFANIIHQTGRTNFKNVESVGKVVLAKSAHAERYHPINYLDQVSMQRAAGIATVVISRAGANSIAEIGLWKKPAILIPIPESVSHDQRTNAYTYAQTGAALVIDEENLTPHLFTAEIQRIVKDPALAKRMGEAAQDFTDQDAARVLAQEVLAIALPHQSL